MTIQYEELRDSQWEVIKEYLSIQHPRKHDLRIVREQAFISASHGRTMASCERLISTLAG